MSFDLEIRINSAGEDKPTQIEQGLNKASDAADRAQASLTKMGEQSSAALDKTATSAERAAGTLDDLKALVGQLSVPADIGWFSGRELEVLERLRGPTQEHNADIDALNKLHTAGAVSLQEYEAELVKLEQRYGATNRAESLYARQIQEEAATFDRLRGPMRAYEQEIQTLERLWNQGKISAEEFYSEAEKQAKKVGVFQGPTQRQPTQEEGEPGLGRALASAGTLLTGGAIGGGIIGLGQQIEGLVQKYHDIEDVAIEAANAAMKFADASHTVNVIIDEQVSLAHDLNSNYDKTIQIYDSVRDGTDELAISHADQIRLTKSLGEEVQIAGKSLESAGGLVARFSYALAAGKIETRELKGIMREIPDLADTWTKHFDTTRQGLMEMVKIGKVTTEDLMRALIDEGAAIDANFAKRERTNKQKEDEWILNEKLYSQRYDVALGSGHGAQATVDALVAQAQASKEGYAEVQRLADTNFLAAWGNKTVERAKAALDQIHENNKAAIGEFIDDVKNMTGPFQEIGDKIRAYMGDTAAVRTEVQKLTEPIDAARAELGVLNQAFATGKIDVDDYTKKYQELQTTLRRGIPDEAYKLNKPIEDARKSLELLIAERDKISTEAFAKENVALQTTINNGRTPEDLRITAPIAQAKIELEELRSKMGQLGGDSEAVRKRYDELMTTINDGRLPETIKLWEELHLPVQQFHRDISALTALLAGNKIAAAAFEAELSKATQTHIAFLETNDASLARKFPDLATDMINFEKDNNILGDNKVNTDPLGHALEERAKQLQIERDELGKVRGPAQQYRIEIAALGDLLEKHKISSERYVQEVDAARLAFLAADPAVKTFGERVEEAWLKAKSAARDAGVETKDYASVAQETLVARIQAKPGMRSQDDLIAIALLKDKQEAEAAGVAASSYAEVVDKVRAAQLAAGQEGKTFAGGMEAEWLKMKLQADSFGSTVAGMLVDDFGKLNDAIVTAANGGTVAWGQMVDSMIQDLERLILKQLEVQAINYAIGAFGGGGGAAVADVASGLSIAGPTSGDIPVPDAIGSAARTDTSTASQSLSQAPTQVILNNHNYLDPSIVTHALSTASGQRAVANVIRRLPKGMRRGG